MQQIPKEHARKILSPGPVVMITAYDEENKRTTGMTCQWQMVVDDTHNVIKMGTNSHTLQCILKTKKYVINVPIRRYVDQVNFFGRNSGKTVNKFEQSCFHLEDCFTDGFGKLIIAESFASIEMIVDKLIPFEDNSYMIVGEVQAARAKKEFFDDGKFLFTRETDVNELPLHHYGGDKYGVICFV